MPSGMIPGDHEPEVYLDCTSGEGSQTAGFYSLGKYIQVIGAIKNTNRQTCDVSVTRKACVYDHQNPAQVTTVAVAAA